MEPEWMKQIPNSNVCYYFYIMFAVVAVFAGVIVLSDVYTLLRGKLGIMALLRSVISFVIPVVNALFLYILCSRSLLEKK
jgi:hypothetical protein